MPCKRNGFSLIEVMVSLVILVIGLIGIFNLHLVAKKGSFESFQQTQASYYANDIINRMRINSGQLATYAGTYTGTTITSAKACDVAVGANVTCTNIETRNWDLYQWERAFLGENEKSSDNKNVGGLDSPTACIDINNTNVTVVITWKGVRASSDGTADKSDFIKGCGASSDRRRALVVNTAIIR
ncbi:type IV pilus modification protein PilV [Shewanella frigidimarina]|uniref:type IV pilus modification protein PilV n=1 Tax=Shewanella frigidimarina TaxID=56812 RepID=UPI000E9834E7|nr:type IV pilus modification protein PilV [Shewanella frigidimarina]RPA38382.1 type IV pilus modification protein PilV [Shewanella frigidimarina]HBF46210.1 type IV pilus modification protein PilV [Shewanella frigidimarina]|tara:strand:- start:10165 stop:10719 length:555 start_codon:yes stop_codon:yes gene_type:complete